MSGMRGQVTSAAIFIPDDLLSNQSQIKDLIKWQTISAIRFRKTTGEWLKWFF
ncbi:MAG: hypothetical protein ABIW47_10435 [Ginsengibacter sp.]